MDDFDRNHIPPALAGRPGNLPPEVTLARSILHPELAEGLIHKPDFPVTLGWARDGLPTLDARQLNELSDRINQACNLKATYLDIWLDVHTRHGIDLTPHDLQALHTLTPSAREQPARRQPAQRQAARRQPARRQPALEQAPTPEQRAAREETTAEFRGWATRMQATDADLGRLRNLLDYLEPGGEAQQRGKVVMNLEKGSSNSSTGRRIRAIRSLTRAGILEGAALMDAGILQEPQLPIVTWDADKAAAFKQVWRPVLAGRIDIDGDAAGCIANWLASSKPTLARIRILDYRLAAADGMKPGEHPDQDARHMKPEHHWPQHLLEDVRNGTAVADRLLDVDCRHAVLNGWPLPATLSSATGRQHATPAAGQHATPALNPAAGQPAPATPASAGRTAAAHTHAPGTSVQHARHEMLPHPHPATTVHPRPGHGSGHGHGSGCRR
ncbi:hypothetical protein OG215_40535 (plasmid) [Streptomyces globisporus]|uniref:hypothetical protein n=1 Tax=Streptomyces globisporus TaxID=1908 RepID=UPI00386B5D24|nr:hypothetical protein OG215_40535 [Streptomyces globisporus]